MCANVVSDRKNSQICLHQLCCVNKCKPKKASDGETKPSRTSVQTKKVDPELTCKRPFAKKFRRKTRQKQKKNSNATCEQKLTLKNQEIVQIPFSHSNGLTN